MRKLIMSIVEFREKMLPQYAKRFRDLALVPRPRGCWCVSLRARD